MMSVVSSIPSLESRPSLEQGSGLIILIPVGGKRQGDGGKEEERRGD